MDFCVIPGIYSIRLMQPLIIQYTANNIKGVIFHSFLMDTIVTGTK